MGEAHLKIRVIFCDGSDWNADPTRSPDPGWLAQTRALGAHNQPSHALQNDDQRTGKIN